MTLKLRKRNGLIVGFDKTKIIAAVKSAMREVEILLPEEQGYVEGEYNGGVSSVIAESVADAVYDKVLKENPDMECSIGRIQDMVEKELQLRAPEAAKRYIIYRLGRQQRNRPKYKRLLSDEFISKFKHLPNPMGELGAFVYYRTYSRWLPDERRREYWWENVRRVVEYNCNLVDNTSPQEAEELFINIYNMRQFLSGRTMWVGNTPIAFKHPMANYNCFARSTEFLTKDGIRTFNDFSNGDTVEVLNANGAWSEATVKSFGEQALYELVLIRNRTKKIIRTTASHLWFVRKSPNEKKYKTLGTIDLSSGMKLREKRRYEHTSLQPCRVAIQHGVTFGDGTFDKKTGHCKVSLIGEKQELADLFTTGSKCSEGNRDSCLIYGLPYNWKELPSVDANNEYKLGFLMGLLAADGSVDGSVTLSNKDVSVLEEIRSMAETIGITTASINEMKRTGPVFGGDKDYDNSYRLTFHKDSIDEQMLLREKHLSKFVASTKGSVWTVESVTPLSEKAEVWCVEEPETNAFALSDGVLTHNCAHKIIDSYKSFSDIFYLSMLGVGVGLNVRRKHVEKLPKIRTDVNVVHESYMPKFKADRIDHTSVMFGVDNSVEIEVGDSKEGWVESLTWFFNIMTKFEFRNVKKITFNYDNVRGKGEKLLGFGGTASGHVSLLNMFKSIMKVIRRMSEEQQALDVQPEPIDALDIGNVIGENVVSGGVRRTAQIVECDPDDEKVMKAKEQLYKKINGEWVINEDIKHRQMSNNSTIFYEKPTRLKLHELMVSIKLSGEPGIINGAAALIRAHFFEGVNPCAEILLGGRGLCNLTTINWMGFIYDEEPDCEYIFMNGKYLDLKGVLRAFGLSTRAAIRMTVVTLELPKWNEEQQKRRLLGVSFTGWQDMCNALGLNDGSQNSRDVKKKLLNAARDKVHSTAHSYCSELKINEPELMTTIKPEGSLSQLPGVSSGAHYNHSEYFIRRVRINADDVLLKTIEALGWETFPEVGQDPDNPRTKIVEFPIHAPAGKTKYDVSAIQQLEDYKMFMEEYVDHNCSLTVHVKDDEWDEVEQWMWDNWDSVVGVTFLSLDNSFYQMLPYEAVDKATYDKMKLEKKPFVPSMMTQFEQEETEIDLGTESCASGSCPVR